MPIFFNFVSDSFFFLCSFFPENVEDPKVSARVLNLTAEITAGEQIPYGKAPALRVHLRKNYSYKRQAAPVPPGRESADFFLFELKRVLRLLLESGRICRGTLELPDHADSLEEAFF